MSPKSRANGANYAAMPNTLHEKAIAQPFRVGLILGALALPSFWVASQDAWRWLQGMRPLNSEEVTQVFAMGFLPGMILGAGALRAWVAWRTRELGEARGLLIGHGGLVVLIAGALLVQDFRGGMLNAQAIPVVPPKILSYAMPMWFYYVLQTAEAVPLQVALAMFLLGLFMRGESA